MADPDRICLRLDNQLMAIEEITNNGDDARELLKRFEQELAKLPFDDDWKDAVAKYETRLAKAQIAAAAVTTHRLEAQQEQITAVLANVQSTRNDLPRDELARHDGNVSSFYAFWKRIEMQLLAREDVDDVTKVSRLAAQLADCDKNTVISGDLASARAYLEEKYASLGAIRMYISETMAKPSMKSHDDWKGAQQLVNRLQNTIAVVDTGDAKEKGHVIELLTLIFNVGYNPLPADIKRDYRNAYPSGKSDPKELLYFLKQRASNLLADQFVAMSVGTPRDPNTSQAKCNYCHVEGHLIRDCDELKQIVCNICKTSGHTAKYCPKKVGSNYPPRPAPSPTSKPKGRPSVYAVHLPKRPLRHSLSSSLVDSFFECKKALVKKQLRDSLESLVDDLFSELVEQAKDMLLPEYTVHAESDQLFVPAPVEDRPAQVPAPNREVRNPKPCKMVKIEPVHSPSKLSGSKRAYESAAVSHLASLSKPADTVDTSDKTELSCPAKKVKSRLTKSEGSSEMDQTSHIPPIPTMMFRGRYRPRIQRGRSSGGPVAHRLDTSCSALAPG